MASTTICICCRQRQPFSIYPLAFSKFIHTTKYKTQQILATVLVCLEEKKFTRSYKEYKIFVTTKIPKNGQKQRSHSGRAVVNPKHQSGRCHVRKPQSTTQRNMLPTSYINFAQSNTTVSPLWTWSWADSFEVWVHDASLLCDLVGRELPSWNGVV